MARLSRITVPGLPRHVNGAMVDRRCSPSPAIVPSIATSSPSAVAPNRVALLGLEPVSKATPHPEAPFAVRRRPRRMLQEAPNSALWDVLRGRFAAPQDEGGGMAPAV